ncbi:sensor histidine kinase [Portibacter marinus]|uniref:sensor histidine kinase n=1 Tax=Portibacter marinus TaxID=2898660 RepID=UPI001F249A86|nr:histidine kinase [Portibacter marinus]
MSKHIILILIAIFNLILWETGRCQSPITFYANISVDSYLKDRQVNRIDRDSSGLFWFLENSVIQQFDGRYVSGQIPHTVDQPKYFNCIADNRILLISHSSEIFIVDTEAKAIFPLELNIPSMNDHQIFDVNFIDKKLYLYFRISDRYLVYESTNYSDFAKSDEFQFRSDNEVLNILKVPGGYLLMTEKDELFEIKGKKQISHSLPDRFREINSTPTSEYLSPDDLLFSFPRRNGTFRYKDGILTTLTENEKLAFAEKDRNGKIFIALSKSFLHSELPGVMEGDSIQEWNELVLINDTYTDIYLEDIEDKLLLGSHLGVFYIELKNPGINSYHQNASTNRGFGNVIMSFAQVPEGDVYYVKENKGIFKFTGERQPESLPISSKLLNNLNVKYDALDGHLWISGYTDDRKGVLYQYNYKKETIFQYDFDYPVMYFERSDKEIITVSSSLTNNSYLFQLNTATRLVQDTILHLAGERTRKFIYLNEEELLIATSKRLLQYHITDQTFKTIVPDVQVQTIAKTSQGFAVCTIGKGIVFIDSSLNVIMEVNEQRGLSSNQVYSVLEDDKGFFWVGTGNGLNILDPDYRYVRYFREYDGLPSYELNTNASIVLSNGRMLYGTINGVVEVIPEKVLYSPESAVLNVPQITYIKDGETVIQKVSNSAFKVPADAEMLEFTVHVNDFYKYTREDNPAVRVITTPRDLSYEVRQDKVIIESPNFKQMELKLLPSNHLVNDQELVFTVQSKRNYKGLLLGMAIVLIIGFISYIIANRIIDFNKKIEKERRENEVKMAELELQALRSQMNPHFIFNSLGAILLYLQTNEKKKAEKYLTKFAKLMRMFLESSKAKFISFAEEQKLLELYLMLEKLRFEDKFDYTFNLDDRLDHNNLVLPSMLLQPFVENAINHGLYHKRSGKGLLEIIAVPDGQNIKIIIRDNGIGREKAAQIKKNSLKKHISRATEIIEERLKLLKSEKNMDSNIIYKDLKSKEGYSLGTEVIITIPKMFKSND